MSTACATDLSCELSLLGDVIRQFRPAAKRRMLDWCCREMYNEKGEPYNHNTYPHLGAPGGPCDAFDDPRIRRIFLQFATRLGKTFFGQSAQLFTAAESPAPMMFVSSGEKLARDVTNRTYKLLEYCRPLKNQLLRDDLRASERVELDHCTLHVAWSRSPSTLADKNIKIGHGSELDKWFRAKTSQEADPLDLFLDRGKDYPAYKFILESTPTVRGASRIETLLLQSTQSLFLVPCPECGKYAPLDFHQIKWSHLPSGEQDIDRARETARYICKQCEAELVDTDRHRMMRGGVWLPAGCMIDHDKAHEVSQQRRELVRSGRFSEVRPGKFWKQDYVLGEPDRDGVNAGFQLSTLAALKRTWGEIAAEWVGVYRQPTRLQNFINSWLGETWAVKKQSEDWERIGEPLISDVPRYIAPTWASVLTVGIDRQLDHYKYLVDAFGPTHRSHTIDFGQHVSLDWIIDHVVKRVYDHKDGGKILVRRTFIDSGYDPKEPYDMVRKCLTSRPRWLVFPCKGSSTPLGMPFKQSVTPDDSYLPGLPLFMIDGDWTQGELKHQLYELQPDDPGSISVFESPIELLEDFFRQLLNDHQILKTDRNGVTKPVWNKDPSYPNDYRDCKRYANAAHLLFCGSRDVPERAARQQMQRRQRPRFTTPDGRPFVATER